jgi:hypothetical protein
VCWRAWGTQARVRVCGRFEAEQNCAAAQRRPGGGMSVVVEKHQLGESGGHVAAPQTLLFLVTFVNKRVPDLADGVRVLAGFMFGNTWRQPADDKLLEEIYGGGFANAD